jgi:hypothetical protein
MSFRLVAQICPQRHLILFTAVSEKVYGFDRVLLFDCCLPLFDAASASAPHSSTSAVMSPGTPRLYTNCLTIYLPLMGTNKDMSTETKRHVINMCCNNDCKQADVAADVWAMTQVWREVDQKQTLRQTEVSNTRSKPVHFFGNTYEDVRGINIGS